MIPAAGEFGGGANVCGGGEWGCPAPPAGERGEPRDVPRIEGGGGGGGGGRGEIGEQSVGFMGVENGEICEFEGAWHDDGGGYGLKCARAAQVSGDAYFSSAGPGGEGDLANYGCRF